MEKEDILMGFTLVKQLCEALQQEQLRLRMVISQIVLRMGDSLPDGEQEFLNGVLRGESDAQLQAIAKSWGAGLEGTLRGMGMDESRIEDLKKQRPDAFGNAEKKNEVDETKH